MLVSMNWINEYVDLSGLDCEALIRKFTLSTAEVEEIYEKGRDLENVIVARVLSVDPHPNSKKLHLLKIDTGSGVVDCVCGAPNVAEGMTVAFAQDGGMVGGTPIRTATVGGYPSQGMCCSEAELGISADNSGLMVLADDLPLGTDIKKLFHLEDTIFEVDNKSLTNRPDLWGHYGIAREFSALTGRPLRSVAVADCSAYENLPAVSVEAQDTELLYRYTAVKIRNIREKISPVNLRIRLFYCGVRAINLLTDLTNYIMLELGQPMHAFDLRRVSSVTVRRFETPFEFQTLDGTMRSIDPAMLMICTGDTPVAIAGVMGGLDSEIEDDTDACLIESANFDGVSIRKTSSRLGLRTDASMRYEKILDPELTMLAAARFIYLVKQIDSGAEVISSVTDCYVRRYAPVTIEFDKPFVDRYTGIDLSAEQIERTLLSLGFTVAFDGQHFTVGVPTWRATKDVTIRADIIEEITRIYGYDNFAISTTKSALSPVRLRVAATDEESAKDLLVEKYGLHETHSYLWCDAKRWKEIGIDVEENVRIINSINPEQVVLRNSMIPTLLAEINDNKLYAADFGIFEIAKVIDGRKPDGTCNERKRLGIALFSRTETEKTLFFRLRDMLVFLSRTLRHESFTFDRIAPTHAWQHPKNTIGISYHGESLGFLGTLHPLNRNRIDKKAAIVFAEIDMDTFSSLTGSEITYVTPGKFPGIDVDLTFTVAKDVPYGELAAVWTAHACAFLSDVRLIGIYENDFTNSVTVRFTFASAEKTLTRSEIAPYIDTIVAALDAKGITVRNQ